MKKQLFIQFIIALSLFPTILSAQIATQPNDFSFECYRHLSVGNQDNLFFSPLSVNAALSMAYAGAESSTQVAFENMMDLSNDKENNLTALADYFHQINSIKNVELNFVNQFWSDKKIPIKSSYENQLTLLAAQSNQVDFQNSSEVTRNQINQSISKSTKGKINNLLPEGSVDGLTQFIMTNAVYFMGDWANTFDASLNNEEAFYVKKDESYTATFMNKKSMYGYYETDKVQVLELLYKGNNLSMVIILPKKDQELAELTASFNQNQYKKWLDRLTYKMVDVAFPKFKTGSNINLANYFAEMGLEEAFSNQADFTGISDKTTKLSKIFHQSFIEVNEKGTEASAASAAIGTAKGISEAPLFKADRPFIYLIKENKNNQVVFMGRLMNPTQKKTSFDMPLMANNTVKKEFIHIVSQGETLFKIAQTYHLKPNEISVMNNLENDLIFEGQRLLIQSENTEKGVVAVAAPQIPKAIPEAYFGSSRKRRSQPKIEIVAAANKENIKVAPKNHHIVQQGETLYSISKKYNLNVSDLKALNQLTTNDLDDGMKLLLKQKSFKLIQYNVKDGDSLSKIARKHNTSVQRIKILNQLSNNMIFINQQLNIEQ
jgi:serpin B